jgi:hypothetical protein
MRPGFILLLLLLLPLPSAAQETPPPAAPPAESTGSGEEEVDEWRERLLEAQARLESARERAAAAQRAYRDGRQRKRPRGEKKAELLAELEGAEQELAEAEAELPVLIDKARRAGVPPGVLREFEG